MFSSYNITKVKFDVLNNVWYNVFEVIIVRKSPTISPRTCQSCGVLYTPSGNGQRFCDDCRAIRAKETKERYYRKRFPNAQPKVKSAEVCCVCGGVFSSHFDGKPYCNKHYLRMKTNGVPDVVGRKSVNLFFVNGEDVRCVTSSGKDFFVSVSDLPAVQKYSWCFSKTGYPVANVKGRVTKLHRYLLNPESKDFVDHIDGDPANNRRSNLRICSAKENSRNCSKKSDRSIVAGVTFHKGKYRARIMVNRKEIALGYFATQEEAVEARLDDEKKYFGDYSPITSRRTSTHGSSE